MNAAAASQLSQATLKEDISYAVAKKSLNIAKQQGQSAISMIQAAASLTPGIGLDPNKGNMIDAYA